MRNLVSAVIAAALVACGASTHAVEAARAARYRGDKLVLFEAARRAIQDKYPVAESDETTLRITTTGRWYTPDGLGASERMGDMRDVPDRSIHLRLVVALVSAGTEGQDWSVSVKPIMMRYFEGRPNPDHLAPDDPSVPGWARGRVDMLHHAIHEALQSYQVKTMGSPTASPQAPEPSTPAPASTPTAPTAPAPAPMEPP